MLSCCNLNVGFNITTKVSGLRVERPLLGELDLDFGGQHSHKSPIYKIAKSICIVLFKNRLLLEAA